jgi:hypothetical protein
MTQFGDTSAERRAMDRINFQMAHGGHLPDSPCRGCDDIGLCNPYQCKALRTFDKERSACK